MPAWLHKKPDKVVTLTFEGTRKRGPFDGQDLANFRQILPHMSRALEIRDRLERAHIRADTLAQRIDTPSFGVAILDASGRILETNAVLQDLLRTDCGIRRRCDGTLCLRNPAGGELARWIASGMAPAHIADGLLKVPRANALPVSILLTPLPAGRSSWSGADPRWLALVFDPDRRVQLAAPLIARDLAISSREAEVTALLVGGYNLLELAQRLGVSTHTVRAQLKSVFRKTGIRSQSDLIRRVALGPARSGSSGDP